MKIPNDEGFYPITLNGQTSIAEVFHDGEGVLWVRFIEGFSEEGNLWDWCVHAKNYEWGDRLNLASPSVIEGALPGLPEGAAIQAGFEYVSPHSTPTLTIRFNVEDWDGRDNFHHALLAASSPKGWEPMESAPRDGTPFAQANKEA